MLKYERCDEVPFHVEGETLNCDKCRVWSCQPSIANVFPVNSRISFYDHLETSSTSHNSTKLLPMKKNNEGNYLSLLGQHPVEEQSNRSTECSSSLVNANLSSTTIGSYDCVKTLNVSSINQLSQNNVNNDNDMKYLPTSGDAVNERSNISLDKSYDTNDCWYQVSDESFLEAERLCQSPFDSKKRLLLMEQNDTTRLFDIEGPAFLNENSTFRSRLSSINEESTEKNVINSLSLRQHITAAGQAIQSNKSCDSQISVDSVENVCSANVCSNDWWSHVSDESFLEAERLCQSPTDGEKRLPLMEMNDTTLLADIEEPTILKEISNFENRLSSINEESNFLYPNVNGEFRDGANYSALKQDLQHFTAYVVQPSKANVCSYRPSLVNVFPTRKQIGFYDYLETGTS